jgi:hypothetical protein
MNQIGPRRERRNQLWRRRGILAGRGSRAFRRGLVVNKLRKHYWRVRAWRDGTREGGDMQVSSSSTQPSDDVTVVGDRLFRNLVDLEHLPDQVISAHLVEMMSNIAPALCRPWTCGSRRSLPPSTHDMRPVQPSYRFVVVGPFVPRPIKASPPLSMACHTHPVIHSQPRS